MNKRRLLSFFVALCMIAAIIPAGIAPASAAEPIVINLNRGNATADMNLLEDHTQATFDVCSFEVATAPSTNRPASLTLYAGEEYLAVRASSGAPRAVLKVKVPAGTYKVYMKTPNVAIDSYYAGKGNQFKFAIGGAIGGANGMGSWNYTGGTELGLYDFDAEGAMGATYLFENTVTFEESADNIRQLDIAYSPKDANDDEVYGLIESFIFEPVGNDEPEEPTDEIVIDLNADTDSYLDLKNNPSLATFNGCGYEVATIASGAGPAAATLRAFSSYLDVRLTLGLPRAVLKVKVPAGTYKVSIKVPDVTIHSDYAGKGNQIKFAVGGAIGDANGNGAWNYTGGTELGLYDFDAEGALGTTYTFENTVTFEESADNIRQFDIAYSPKEADDQEVYGLIESIIFEKVEPKAEVPASDIFGNTYAYVKDGKVYFIGGLKTIEGYSSVGFEVWVNGNKVDDITTDKVYTSFTVAGQTVSASDWASQYVFITEKSVSAGDAVKIKPYIAKGEVKTYHADAFTLELTI